MMNTTLIGDIDLNRLDNNVLGCYTNINNCVPYTYPTYSWTTTNLTINLLEVNKCKNGYKVKFANEEYVFESLDNLMKFIKQQFKEQENEESKRSKES
jgi:hypothetical protein